MLHLSFTGHAKLACPVCKTAGPDIKTLQIHHEAKHPKLPWDESSLINQHATVAPLEKPKPGVRGSLKKV